MLLSYGLKDGDVKDYLAVVTEEECVETESFEKGKRSLFSARPYLLAIDYDKIFTLDAVLKCLSTDFTGSKILYCLFFGKTYKKGYRELAEALAKDKGLVLYGNDFLYLNEDGTLKENEWYKLRGTAEYVKDFRPFNAKAEESPVLSAFGLHAKKA